MIYEPFPIGRICRVCNVWKPRAELRKNRKQPDGIERLCVLCSRAQATRYFQEHREEVLQKHRDEYATNPEKIKARNKRARNKPTNKAKTLLTVKNWQQRNPDKVKGYKKKWQLAHPTETRIYQERRIARRASLPDTLTPEQWLYCLEYWKGKCCICGRPTGFWHIIVQEHWIPVHPGYELIGNNPGTCAANILPMCHAKKNGEAGCNNSKRNYDPVIWLTKRLGTRQAKAKLAEIETYFRSVTK